MSELINRNSWVDLRRQLMVTVSALALTGFICARDARADTESTDRPVVWIELGGQLERVDNAQVLFSPPFVDLAPSASRDAMTDSQRPPGYSIGGEGKITFAPEDTNWILSAAVRYGRSNADNHLHHQTPAVGQGRLYYGSDVITTNFVSTRFVFGDGQATLGATHLVLDFQAGRDIGVGLFGGGSSSVVSAGVRFAQFTASSDVTLHARPVEMYNFVTVPGHYRLPDPFHGTYTAVSHAKRDTHALGPSLSWDASSSLAGNDTSLTLALDWGVNAAVLFGRQHVRIQDQTTGNYSHKYGKPLTAVARTGHYVHPANPDRSRAATIPNVGGFAGISLEFPNAKVSLGYRADFFFGAMDGGFDTAKRENVGFYGPFATISVGIGG